MILIEWITESLATLWGWIKTAFVFLLEVIINCGEWVIDILIVLVSCIDFSD